MGIGHHIQKVFVEVGLSLKVEDQVKQVPVYLVNCLFKELIIQHAFGAGKLAKSAWALRTTQIAGGSRLK